MQKTQVITLESLTLVLSKNLELALYTLAFVFPLILHGQQLLVGPVVNAVLFFAARKMSYQKLLPLLVLPSLAAIARGVVIGPLTMFLVYLLPFVWISNLIMVFVAKKMVKKNFVLKIGLASGLKSAFLFIMTYVLFKVGLVPAILLTAMGVLQLVTAIAGGLLEKLIYERTK